MDSRPGMEENDFEGIELAIRSCSGVSLTDGYHNRNEIIFICTSVIS